MPDVLDEINGLKDLNEPDWDSYGAEPVSREAIAYASKFVQQVWSQLGYRPQASAGPRPGGGVSLIWRGSKDCMIEVCFDPIQPRSPSYILTQGSELLGKGSVEDLRNFAKKILGPIAFR